MGQKLAKASNTAVIIINDQYKSELQLDPDMAARY